MDEGKLRMLYCGFSARLPIVDFQLAGSLLYDYMETSQPVWRASPVNQSEPARLPGWLTSM